MPAKVKSAGVAATLLLLAVYLGGTTRMVVPPGTDLSATLEVLADGDTLWLLEGLHRGPLLIERAIYLGGDNYPVIQGDGAGDVIVLAAPGIEISGLIIRGSGSRLIKDFAGIKVLADDCRISANRIVDNLHGIYVKQADRIRIAGNYIEGRLSLNTADRGNGIHLWNSRQNEIVDNSITRTRDGIYFSFVNETSIRGNLIQDLRYGLHYMYSDSNRFTDNVFERCMAGAALMYSNEIHFEGNVFANCRGFESYGILYQSCERCTARGNLIYNNTRGIYLTNAIWNQFAGNDIIDNGIALMIDATAESNTIFANNFMGNLTQLMQSNGRTDNQFVVDGRGNYWSNYRGYDMDRDGIGDTPHALQNVFEHLEGLIPETRLYLYSPAARLLEVLEDSFPILNSNPVQDAAPLIFPVQSGPTTPAAWIEDNGQADQKNWVLAMVALLCTLTPVVAVRRFSA